MLSVLQPEVANAFITGMFVGVGITILSYFIADRIRRF